MTLTEYCTGIADAIREKEGSTELIPAPEHAARILALESGGGSEEEWIGDGDTHIWVTLREGRTSPRLGVGVKGTVTVDWGDGSNPDTLTGTSTSTVVYTPVHNYAAPGDYIITLSGGNVGILAESGNGSFLLRGPQGANTYLNYAYENSIRMVELSGLVTAIGEYGFSYCCSLTTVHISDSVTSIGGYAFNSCYSLLNTNIPDGVTSIGNTVFSHCRSLIGVHIPYGVKSIGNYAFNNCYCVTYYDFSHHTAVPTLSNTNALNGIPSDCQIRVPVALVDSWKAATNWSTYASYIVGV